MRLANLEAEMKRSGIERKEIAKALNRNVSAIHRWINCYSSPTMKEAKVMRDRFFPDCSLSYLFEEFEK